MTESDTAAAAPEAPAVATATALSGVVPWLERRQVALYLLALIAGGVLGLGVPAVAEPAEAAINPVLVLLSTPPSSLSPSVGSWTRYVTGGSWRRSVR